MKKRIHEKLRRWTAACLCGLLLFAGSGTLVSASEEAAEPAEREAAYEDYQDYRGTRAVSTPIEIFAEDEPEEKIKNYTVMVYMVGSTLEYNPYIGLMGNGTLDILEMLYAGVDYSRVNVLVFTGGTKGWLADIPNDRNCVLDLSRFQGNSFSEMIAASTLENENMGDPGTMAGFINFCEEYYPAEHYGLICWDHGGGPNYGYGEDTLFDDDGLELPELQQAMELTSFHGGRRLDWIGFDACLMGTVEIANILAPYADYMLASEESEVAEGWDYQFLSFIGRNDPAEEMLETMVDYCGSSMASGDEDSTLSCLKLDKIPALVKELDRFFAFATTGLVGQQNTAIANARRKTKEFGMARSIFDVDFELVDIVDLADNFRGLYAVSASSLRKAAQDAVLCQYSNVERANGICMYYPADEIFLHILYLSGYYDRVNPSQNYRSFLQATSDILLTGETSVKAPFADLEAALAEAAAEEAASQKPEDGETGETEGAGEQTQVQPETEPASEETAETESDSVEEGEEQIAPSGEPEEQATPSGEPEEQIAPSGEPEEEAETVSGSSEAEEESTEPPASPLEEYGDEDILFQLTPEQQKTFTTATYTVMMYTGDQSLTPYVLNVPLIPDEDGMLHVPSDPDIVCLTTDESPRPIPWRVRLGEITAERTTYNIVSTALVSGPEFDEFSKMMSVSASLSTEPGSNTVVMQNMQPGSDSGQIAAAKTSIDMTRWEGIVGSISGFLPASGNGDRLLPWGQWPSDGSITMRTVPLDGSFGFTMRKASELPYDFAMQIVMTDVYGNYLTSDLLKTAEKQPVETAATKTEKGEISYQILDGEAVVTGYTGTDEILEIPETAGGCPVTEIGPGALQGSRIRTLILPVGLSKISEKAAADCRELAKIELPFTLEEIGYGAFRNAVSLEEIILPEELRRLGKASFSGCSALRSIQLPGSLETIGTAAFAGCTSLETIQTEETCAACRAEGDVLLSADGKMVLACAPSGKDEITIPDGVERIGYGTFAYARELSHVAFPESLRAIENYAFFACFGLESLELPESLASIGTAAFGKRMVSYSVDEQKAKAAIDSVRIGAAVEYIGADAFSGIGASSILPAEENVNYSSRDGFLTNKNGDFILEAPGGLGAVIRIPEGVTGLAGELFRHYGSEEITDVYMPDSLKDIPNNIFSSGWDENFNKTYYMTIHGSAGSAAEAFAETNGIAFLAE